MDYSGIIKKKESGKDKLDPKDMAAASGMDEGYIRKAMKHGFLNPPHYTSQFAIDGVELSAQDKERVEKQKERFKAARGMSGVNEKAISEVATAKIIEETKLEGRPIHHKYREKSAEEVFAQFWDSPIGKARMTGKLKKEIANIDRGGEWHDQPTGHHAMPDNWEQVLWETTKQEAARLYVLAQTGDKEAEEKYRVLQSKFPEQLPQYGAKGEPAKEDKRK